MLVETLKVCAGKFNFRPGQEVEIPDDAVADLVSAGAIKDPNPDPEAKKPVKKPAKKASSETE